MRSDVVMETKPFLPRLKSIIRESNPFKRNVITFLCFLGSLNGEEYATREREFIFIILQSSKKEMVKRYQRVGGAECTKPMIQKFAIFS